MCKYPHIKVRLVGNSSNAFYILGACCEAMRRAGLSKETRDKFLQDAKSGDYSHLLATCMEWFDVE